LFHKLREEQPSNFKKLVLIFGDVKEKGLGLSAADRQMLIERITIVIHAAASVRFNDNLKYVIFANTRATRDICILAQSMKNLKVPFEGIVWTINQTITDNFTLYYILTILLHMLPAMLIDLILNFSGRRPILVRLQRKVYVINRALGYYGCNEWKFSNVNSLALMSSISPDDWNTFSFNYSNCDLKAYAKNCIIGSKKFLLHEDMNRLDAARAHRKRVHLFVKMVKSMVSIGVLWLI
ncbi:Fatty acyl-CoA reductase, partial [Temnothorax longispinosus]